MATASSLFYDLIEDVTNAPYPVLPNSLLKLKNYLESTDVSDKQVLLDVNQTYLEYFNTVVDCVSQLLTNFQQLSIPTLESIWLLQMLMMEDKTTVLKIMSIIQMINKTRQGVFARVSSDQSKQILDELMYKILDTSEPEIASSSARTVLEICRNHAQSAKIIFTRYKGLRAFTERWIKEPFMKDFQILLDAGSVEQAKIKKLELDVIKIQSFWRSYSTRKKLKQANHAFTQFHISYRNKKLEEKTKAEELKMENDLKFMLQIQRKYNMRRLHMKQLIAIQILPASKVEEYLIEEQNNAATRIQSTWKMYRIKNNLGDIRRKKFLNEKASTIQTFKLHQFRRYQRRKELKTLGEEISSSSSSGNNVPDLLASLIISEERRQQLQDIIQERLENRKPAEFVSREHSEELHSKVQTLLANHVQHELQPGMRKQKMMITTMRKKIDADVEFLTAHSAILS
ncbi:hypothetical protein HELRODRAFT_172083 [Helobdella robusta]|uniref:IQ calmodulin-binding motif-containing protein 1 n=1 Tax=Helobdella robusta TaxID=6412 RepID=T1F505_HELRO|nr:hypothetical protein HELRODRAFT_172083 [Helobdella robusta]ESO05067.1 hypothetical protein HELRODRAFT_172083 [Helobdella robusta]